MNNNQRMKWFTDSKFGLFIHWGLYALPAGQWLGKKVEYPAEWIMKNAKIPLAEYRKLVEQFNPIDFDAYVWMRKAKAYGVKYVCLTAKHHDGFALYDSDASDYSVMSTPFRRDIVRELAEACKAEGLIFCVYYSQMQDWEDANADGNDWDFDRKTKNFVKYFQTKVKPQVRELLTNYGDIGMIWFDTPYDMPKTLCQELADWVHQLQPDCLINGRIGYGIGDYRTMSDNNIPVLAFDEPWETPMTLNNNWGFSKVDFEWKSAKDVIRMLVSVVGKGGNLLLNMGPDALGNFPEKADEVFSQVGAWLKKNGESIYQTNIAPDLTYQTRWGGLTAGKDRLYLHILDGREVDDEVVIYDLELNIKKAYLLETGQVLETIHLYEPARDEFRLRVKVPNPLPDLLDTVIVLEHDGDPVVHSLESKFSE